MIELSDGQRRALDNLRQKKAGEAVGWINISDARLLADLGLARRTAAGWVVTAAGEAHLAGQQTSGSPLETAFTLSFANDETIGPGTSVEPTDPEPMAPAEGLEPPTS